MKACEWNTKCTYHAFLYSTLDCGELWSAYALVTLSQRKEPWDLFIRRLGGPQSVSGMTMFVYQIIKSWVIEGLENNKFGVWKKGTRPHLRQNPRIYFEELKKTIRNFKQSSRSMVLNRRTSEYESGMPMALFRGSFVVICNLFTKIHRLVYRFVFKGQK